MITRKTAAAIAYSYDEITAARTLLAEAEKAYAERREPDFRDNFGRQRGLELGVPSGDVGHRLFTISPSLARIVIEAHINAKKMELTALNDLALQELQMADAP